MAIQKRQMISLAAVSLVTLKAEAGLPRQCLPPAQRQDCGRLNYADCIARGCCYDDSHGSDWCSYFGPGPTPSPAPAPEAWQAKIASGDMLYFRRPVHPLDSRLYPSIGNGFLATIAKSSHMYIAGVYNLSPAGTYEPYRARFPGLSAMSVSSSGSADWADDEALDMSEAVFLRRGRVRVSTQCVVTVEQRTYAHRKRLGLLVTDFAFNATLCESEPGIVLSLLAGEGSDPAERQDFNWSSYAPSFAGSDTDMQVYGGATLKAEAGLPRQCLPPAQRQDCGRLNYADCIARGCCYDDSHGSDWCSYFGPGPTPSPASTPRRINAAFATLAPTTGSVNVTIHPASISRFVYPSYFATDVEGVLAVDALAANVTAELAAAMAAGADLLYAEHARAVQAERGAVVEVGVGMGVGMGAGPSSGDGALALARLVNVTQYSLRASLSPSVEWSTSPGGLPTGGRWTADGHDTHGGAGYPEGGSSYYGHVFWDADVWMLPAVLPLRPDIARAMIAYRKRTMGAALRNAGAQGRNGTKWVWESAFTGTSATGGTAGEIHLQAGIVMSLRQYYRATGDTEWLQAVAWPMITNFVKYFESRATRDPNTGALSLNNVESPNEYAVGINNDIYTNCAFASVLSWIASAAAELGRPAAEYSRYKALGEAIVIPFNQSLGRHMEYTHAPEALRIKQATLTMVPFPVMWPMDADVQRRDLEYEAAHIGDEGPAMTHSMLAIDWLSIGNSTGGDMEFVRSYEKNVLGPFLQWMECPIPPDFCQGHRPATNFLTAAGGFMQAILYGFAGLRYNDGNLTLVPRVPGNATGVSLRGLFYRGHSLDVVYDNKLARVTLRNDDAANVATAIKKKNASLCLVASDGKKVLAVGKEVSVATGAFAIEDRGCN